MWFSQFIVSDTALEKVYLLDIVRLFLEKKIADRNEESGYLKAHWGG